MVKLKDILDKLYEKLGLIDDYIVERGTRDGWRYVRYNSGRTRLFYKQTWTVTSWKKWMSMFYSNSSPNLQIPAGLVTSIDNLNIQCTAAGVDAWGITANGGSAFVRNVPPSYLVRPDVKTTNNTATRFVTLEGTWK